MSHRVTANASVTIHLSKIRANAQAIRQKTGVDLIAVVKCDAYGCGAVAVADAIKGIVSGFYVFSAREAIAARLFEVTGKTTIAAVPDAQLTPSTLAAQRVRQAVWSIDMARHYKACSPVLSVDTGMQRFACPGREVRQLMSDFSFDEAFTHGVRPEHASELARIVNESTTTRIRLHAAASALIDQPSCWLDATRPGLALYHDAITVRMPLTEVRASRGVVGYTRFSCEHHGVILAGYSHGLSLGPCLVNGRLQQIVEVGMQSSYVTLDPNDRAGDAVTLLGTDGSAMLSAADVAKAWKSTPQQVLVRLSSLGERSYDEPKLAASASSYQAPR